MTRALLALPLFLGAALSSAADPVIKVGVIGLDNYQAVAFTELFHHPKGRARVRQLLLASGGRQPPVVFNIPTETGG